MNSCNSFDKFQDPISKNLMMLCLQNLAFWDDAFKCKFNSYHLKDFTALLEITSCLHRMFQSLSSEPDAPPMNSSWQELPFFIDSAARAASIAIEAWNPVKCCLG